MHMAINRKPQLLRTNFDRLQEYIEFKVDFYHVSIQAQKDPKQKWHGLHYLAIGDPIDTVLEHWMVEWRTTLDLTTGSSKSIA